MFFCFRIEDTLKSFDHFVWKAKTKDIEFNAEKRHKNDRNNDNTFFFDKNTFQ